MDIKDDFIVIGCKKGSIKVAILQAPSKKEISSIEYLRGQRLNLKDILA